MRIFFWNLDIPSRKTCSANLTEMRKVFQQSQYTHVFDSYELTINHTHVQCTKREHVTFYFLFMHTYIHSYLHSNIIYTIPSHFYVYPQSVKTVRPKILLPSSWHTECSLYISKSRSLLNAITPEEARP